MAGATIDRKLTGKSTGRVSFAIAGSADDADIRRLLRESPMTGQVVLTLEREPNYFADYHLPGTEKQTIIAREQGRAVCVGACSIRDRFVNGLPVRVGYLGGLRLEAIASGRFDILRRGYEYFRELQSAIPADLYFTSIASDNLPARRFLERGLPGMPLYEHIGDFVTVVVPVGRRSLVGHSGMIRKLDMEAAVKFMNDQGRLLQLAPVWSVDELAALSQLGLRMEDACSVTDDSGQLTASAMLWDQRSFKQTVIRGYSRWLALARPAINLSSRLFHTPRLPKVGSTLAHAFVSSLRLEPGHPEALVSLINCFKGIASASSIDYLTLGFAANDPGLQVLRKHFHGREYRSRLYAVRWKECGGASVHLDGRCLGPEVALL